MTTYHTKNINPLLTRAEIEKYQILILKDLFDRYERTFYSKNFSGDARKQYIEYTKKNLTIDELIRYYDDIPKN